MFCNNAGYVDPVKDIGALLLEVEKPGRYCGGEYGRLAERDSPLQTLIAFPDLYEIGMSNQALRIIYNGLNRIPGISCDRAFAPAPDFEHVLRDRGLPLYGLDTGISLKSLDLLLFTLGYELGISGIFAMLDISGIPLYSHQRGGDDPLVIAGGPAVSNPLPYSAFIDAFWIGEAEAGFFDLAAELLEIKQNGAGRAAMFEHIKEHPNIWVKEKGSGSGAARAVDSGFAERDTGPAVYPIPSMKIVQHHGILEIMRGCPNGCRFCHAGYWYRPMRQKKQEILVREAEAFISQGGYREISLSSLSSGDYSGIGELVDSLNRRFSGRHVSFQLPSLRVSTFSLSLLEKISQTRKSGLTFAVETPLDFWQLAINKQVTEDFVVEILREAKRNGWRGAKFYFMTGLPVPPLPDGSIVREEEEIVNFINNITKRTGMRFNINAGIFVPKPHTPYQRARQMDGETAAAKLEYIRSRLKPQGHKVSISNPLVSLIEGILSRGDERAGELASAAFHLGSRLDAWQEFIDKDAWLDVLAKNTGVVEEFLSARDIDASLPWQSVASGVSPAYLRKEFEKSERGEMTASCVEHCDERCGVCGKSTGIRRNGGRGPMSTDRGICSEDQNTSRKLPYNSNNKPIPQSPIPDPSVWRLLFSFAKEGAAVFHGHLSLIEIFSMAMARAGLDVLYTQGFNPLAKLEIVSPLSTGISAGAEMAAADFPRESFPGEFIEKMNAALPEGIRINRAECYHIPSGGKKHSLSSLLWGFAYAGLGGGGSERETVYIPAPEEKAHREKCLSAGLTLFSLRRESVLAKNIITDTGTAGNISGVPQPLWASYFDVYRHLYGKRKQYRESQEVLSALPGTA